MSRGKLSLRDLLIVSRPYWWVNTAAPFVVGALLARHDFNLTLLIGTVYFLIPYNLLMYGVNDIFDYESDIRNPRKSGSVDGAVLARIKHPALRRAILISNLPFLVYLVLAGNTESNVFLLMMIYMVLAYSVSGLRYKEIPVIDSLTSAFHYASPFIFALFLYESPNLWAPAFAAFYFWVVGNHAFGAIRDIGPDRAAGIKSIATRLGAAKTLWACLVAYSLAITSAVLGYGIHGVLGSLAILPYVLIILSVWRYRRNDSAPQFMSAWKRFLIMNYLVGAICSVVLIYLYNR